MPMLSDDSPITFNDAIPNQADVVIIGGGVIGISTAWFLAKAGVSVLVCEKGRIAGEQSSRNWGWVRQMGRDEAELPIVTQSLKSGKSLQRRSGTISVSLGKAYFFWPTTKKTRKNLRNGWRSLNSIN